MAQGRPQTSNYHFGKLVRFGMRLLTITTMLQLCNRNGSVINQVNAQNTDKVAFQIFEIDSQLQNILWCGSGNEVILVQSAKGTVYRSRDKGDSWKKLHSYMHQTGSSVLDDGQTDIGHVRKMTQSPVQSSLVVFLGSEGINWVTEDCGANLKALNPGKKIHEFMFHPKKASYALAAGWTECEKFEDESNGACEIVKELYATDDMGTTWKFIKNYVHEFTWGVTTYSYEIPRHQEIIENHELRIFITHEPNGSGHQKRVTRGQFQDSIHLYYSDDYFKTEHQALSSGNSVTMTAQYMFVGRHHSDGEIKIFVSRAEHAFLDFKQARLPMDYHLTDHFQVMDTSEKAVFLFVSDPESDGKIGHMFVSDGIGFKFSHSVENVIKGYHVDFETIQSLEGTFIANRYDSNHGKLKKGDKHMGGLSDDDIAREFQRQDSKMGGNKMSSPTGSKKQAGTKKAKDQVISMESFESKIKTYITHNKGGEWGLIRAPEQDLKGKSTNCFLEDHCSLHIQMYYNNHQSYAPPYSQDSALGIIMGVGNLGQNLDLTMAARKGTFLSRDGGVEWTEVAKIPLIYELGDHGGLIVAAPNTESTKQIRYSWDEGKTWTKLQISDVPIFVDNIIIEPTSTAQQFVIYGSYDNTTEESEWDIGDDIKKGGDMGINNMMGRGEDVMVSLDFANLHEPTCKGLDSPGSEHSDYELWTPHDGRHGGGDDKCFNGQQITYTRRKQSSSCFNGEINEPVTKVFPCKCTEKDYECDVDFLKDSSGQCKYIGESGGDTGSMLDSVHFNHYSKAGEDCKDEKFYETTKGYRKIPGNKCYGGVDLNPKKSPCNNWVMVNEYLGDYPGAVLFFVAVVIYFLWDQIEPIVATFPIPDPKVLAATITGTLGLASASAASYASSGSSAFSSNQSGGNVGYESNLDKAPEAYLEGEDSEGSDEGLGKSNAKNNKLNYDNDSSNDENDVESAPANAGNELIDLGESSAPSVAKKIPKLSGPK